MKRWLALSGILACAFVVAFAPAAMADVKGTHHDMNTFVGGSRDTCYPCHGYQELTYTSTLGKVGSLCYSRCHVGGGGVIPTNLAIHTYAPKYGTMGTDNTMAVNMPTGFVPSDKYVAHGFNKSLLPGSDNALVGNLPAWPYLSGARMECTSCHDVHTNTYTPFLRANLSDNTVPSASFCMQCHRAGDATAASARWTIMGAGTTPNGGHPVEVGTGGNLWTNDTVRRGRAIALKDVYASDNGVFRNNTPAQSAMGGATTHFNPGGKLGNPSQTGSSGNVGCYTCHATHMPAAAGMSQFTVARWKLGGSTRTKSEMCVGCHGAAATDGRNPGVTNYYHPNNGETRVVSIATLTAAEYTTTTPGTGFSIFVNISGADYNTTGIISCSSCHGNTSAGSLAGVHDLEYGNMLINPTKATCSACHDATSHALYQTGNGAVHHPIGGIPGAEPAQWATNGFRSSFTWNATDNAVLSDGLGCADCHKFNGTAHNWN